MLQRVVRCGEGKVDGIENESDVSSVRDLVEDELESWEKYIQSSLIDAIVLLLLRLEIEVFSNPFFHQRQQLPQEVQQHNLSILGDYKVSPKRLLSPSLFPLYDSH